MKTINIKEWSQVPERFTGIAVGNNGTYWYKEGRWHREDGPAVEHNNGYKEWRIEGKLYSEKDFKEKIKSMKKAAKSATKKAAVKKSVPKKAAVKKAAVKMKVLNLEWNHNISENYSGIAKYPDGTKIWFKDGKYHREDGPAIEYLNGTKAWFKNGKRHRVDGPAIEYASGVKEWYLGDQYYLLKEWEEKVKEFKKPKIEVLKLELNEEIPKNYSGVVEYINGIKCWIKNGKKHRDDGPAVESANGTKYWYKEGKWHRDDGPALEFANGTKEWWFNGKNYSEKDFKEKFMSVEPTAKPTAKKAAVKKTVSRKATNKILKLGWGESLPENHTGIIQRPDGTKQWHKNGNLHREDGPAVEYTNGEKEWFENGKRHRVDGPAIECRDGSKSWYKEGKYHREDGPAIEEPDGHKQWWVKGNLHREDGPAIESRDGGKWWYKEGFLHREDGPAVESEHGPKHWYLEGKKYSEKTFKEKIKTLKKVVNPTPKLKTIKVNGSLNIPENFTGIAEYLNGEKRWYKEGKLHREDGPAVEWLDGSKNWLKEGKYHREDGPAVERPDGTKFWYKDGRFHREDGPACEYSNGDKEWYKDGGLHREDGPAVEQRDGSKHWFKNDKRHRENGPAIEYANGGKYWYKDNLLHREDGPAIEESDGYKEWWFDGKIYTEEQHPSLTKLKTSESQINKQKVLQVVISDSKEVALRIAVQKINLISKSVLLKLFQKTKYSKMEDILNSEIGRAILKAISSVLLEMLKSKFDDKYKLILGEISKEFRIQAETDLSVEFITKLEAFLQGSPSMDFIQTRISIGDLSGKDADLDNNQEVETTATISGFNSMLN